MKTSLIITTYNSPKYLRLTLQSVLNQRKMPDEVIIADDGSGKETESLINEFRDKFGDKLIHVWHPDEGFRLAAIRNKAIQRATGDYIIQIDGDIILHPKFIYDHIKYATKGYFVGASRSFVKSDYSNKILSDGKYEFNRLHGNSDIKMNSLRIPVLTPIIRHLRKNAKFKVRGCNMAYWRDDALRINGYNEDIEGWGKEDLEFCARLSNLGLKAQWLKFSAIEYHIYHNENNKESSVKNEKMAYNAITTGITYIKNGINKEI